MKLGMKVDFHPSFARRRQRELGEFVEEVMTDFSDTARVYTPVRTGAARRAWHTEGTGAGTEAVNNKAYIQRLENNWSRQTNGRGILKPTKRDIRRKYR